MQNLWENLFRPAEQAPTIEATLDGLCKKGRAVLHDLETEDGILASARNEAYGCIFGRDSLITSLEMLSADAMDDAPHHQDTVRKVLRGLVAIQGTKNNIQNGEEVGKIPHEHRPKDHEKLTGSSNPNPWFTENGVMTNYDSVDSTPLFALTTARFIRQTGDEAFFDEMELPVRGALGWICKAIDKGNGFLIYTPWYEQDGRTHGGLTVQSWQDSSESLFHEDGTEVKPPVASVEVQAYGYAALSAWADLFGKRDAEYARTLRTYADKLKQLFNEKFVIKNDEGTTLASGIDGEGKQIESVRSTMGHVLFATWEKESGGAVDGVLDEEHIQGAVERLLKDDMFVPHAGIRTLSTKSSQFEENSYHNGSVWPHDTFLLSEGLANYGYHDEAQGVRGALLMALVHFNTPIELFVAPKDGGYEDYSGPNDSTACKEQAWAAGAMTAGALAYKRHKEAVES